MQNIADIVEKNGKTIRQNNMELTHKIPIDALVELSSDYESFQRKWGGVRLYVVGHSRDCDGEPLYNLGPKRDPASNREEYLTHSGFGEDNLKVIMLP